VNIGVGRVLADAGGASGHAQRAGLIEAANGVFAIQRVVVL
jgi:hypothetical protein